MVVPGPDEVSDHCSGEVEFVCSLVGDWWNTLHSITSEVGDTSSFDGHGEGATGDLVGEEDHFYFSKSAFLGYFYKKGRTY